MADLMLEYGIEWEQKDEHREHLSVLEYKKEQRTQELAELDIKLEEAVVEDDTDYDFQPAFVVFRCTEEQAQTLIRLERMESLHLTLQRTGG